MKEEKSVALVGSSLKIPKKIQDRLVEKMLEMNDTKIIERIQQRNSHIEAISRIDKEIEEMCTLQLNK